jgi:hypothetical protein
MFSEQFPLRLFEALETILPVFTIGLSAIWVGISSSGKHFLRARVRAFAGARFIFNLFRFLGHLSE